MIAVLFLAVAPDLTGVVQLFGRFSMAHACPIAADRALTAAHVPDLRPFDGTPLYPFRWQQGEADGITIGGSVSLATDLADLQPSRPFSKWYPLATTAPTVGAHLWIRGYDFRKAKNAFGPRDWEVEVLRVVAGHVVFKPTVDFGTSGSCILNEDGEVVGVIAKGVSMHNDEEVGVGVGVWGGWLKPRKMAPLNPPAEEPVE
jgi:hypothetical protein